jgi:hypothetical protein
VTKAKLIGNLLVNQARVEESHGGRKQCFWEGGLQIFSFFEQKNLKKIGSFGFFFS